MARARTEPVPAGPASPAEDLPPDDGDGRRSRTRSRGGRSKGGRRRTARERTLAALLALVVVGSVLAIGAVHVPVLLVVGAGAVGATALAFRMGELPARAAPVGGVFWITVALAAFSLLQAVPLPLAWVQALAPANADVWSRSLLPFHEGPPAWVSLSLDPGASVVEGLKWLVYGGVFATAAVVGSRFGAEWGVGMVFAGAVAAALTTLGHGLAGATRVFGLYQPTFQVAPWHIGPLLNPNNLAGYLNLGAMCGVGLLLMHRPIAPRWLLGLGVAAVVGVGVTSASRGGVLALILGFALLALVLRLRLPSRRAEERASWSRRPMVALWLATPAAAAGLLLAVLGGTEETWTELYDRNADKLRMMTWARPLLADHPWLGIGRGAFESVFPAYRAGSGDVVYTHLESFPAQWAVEWGMPVAAGALLGLAWFLRPGKLAVRRSAVAAGVWVGFMVLLAQNLLDLALEIPAVCIAAAAALGSIAGDRARQGDLDDEGPEEDRRESGGWGRLRRLARWGGVGAVAVAGAAVLAATARWGWHDLGTDQAAARTAFREASREDAAARGRLRGDLRAAMRRHPAEPYFPLLGALVAWRAQDESPMPWLQRALERAQVNGKAHLLLAEVLSDRRAKQQALFELRLVAEEDPGLTLQAALLAVRWASSFEELLAAVPDGAAGATMLDLMAGQLTRPADAEVRRRCDREALARDASKVGPHYRLAMETIEALGRRDGERGACQDRLACEAAIEAHAAAIEVRQQDTSAAAQLRARRLLAEGRGAEGQKLLADACERVTDRVECLEARAEVASQANLPDALGVTVKELLTSACTAAGPCAAAANWAGDLFAGRRDWGLALVQYARASREDPTEVRWLKLADVAAGAGMHAQAVEALEKVAKRRGGADPALGKRIEQEKQLALSSLTLH